MSEGMKKGLVPVLRFPEFWDLGEWEQKPLGKVAEIITGNTPSTSDSSYYGGNRMFVSPADISDGRYIINTKTTLSEQGYSMTRKIPAYSVLFVCIGSTIGKVAQNKFDCATNQQINALVPFENYASGFIYFALDNEASRIAELAGKQAVPIINKSLFSSVLVSFPSPNEQQKIADCLSSIDDLITAQTQKIEALKAHKKALMQQLFPAEGETVPKLRFPEFWDEGEWEQKPLGKVAEIITGNTPSTSDSSYYGGNRMFVSPADISDGRYIINTKTTLSEQGYSMTRKIPADSVLFVCIGSTIGKVAQNKFDCATNQQINALVPFENYASGFIYFALDNEASRIAELAGKQAVPIINKSLFSSVLVGFTSPNEQQKIADCLSSIDDLITAQTQKIEALKAHKKGLMQQLFPSSEEAEL
jgi:type I restriction enzyme S subunit